MRDVAPARGAGLSKVAAFLTSVVLLATGSSTASVAAEATRTASQPECQTGNVLVHSPDWSTITVPVEAESGHGTGLFVADTLDPNRLFWVKGSRDQILRTLDGGCTWKKVWDLPNLFDGELPDSNGRTRHEFLVSQLYLPPNPDTPGTIFLVGDAGLDRPKRLFVSENNGDDWEERDTPPQGPPNIRLRHLFGPLERPDRLYWPAQGGAERPRALYVSKDGGRSWAPAGPVGVFVACGSVCDDLQPEYLNTDVWLADPKEADSVFTVHGRRNNALLASTDGGVTFSEIGRVPLYPRKPAIARLPGGAHRIAAVSGSCRSHQSFADEVVVLSDDGGRSFRKIATPAGFNCQIGLAPLSGKLILAMNQSGFGEEYRKHELSGLWRLDERALALGIYPWVRLPVDVVVGSGPMQLQVSATKRPVVHAIWFTDEGSLFIERYSGRL